MKRIVRYVAMTLGTALSLGVMHSQQAASQTGRTPQFENEDVKVWKSVVMPNAPLNMHHHDHPRVIIALRGGTMKIVQQNGTSESRCGRRARPTGCPRTRPTRCTRM